MLVSALGLALGTKKLSFSKNFMPDARSEDDHINPFLLGRGSAAPA